MTDTRRVRSIVEEGDAALTDDFYRCPTTGEWVYRWTDERCVLRLTDEHETRAQLLDDLQRLGIPTLSACWPVMSCDCAAECKRERQGLVSYREILTEEAAAARREKMVSDHLGRYSPFRTVND